MSETDTNPIEIGGTLEQPPTWQSLGLSPQALELIQTQGFPNPTPVQAAAIPPALEGKDLIASAQTGTGKTASFVLPMVERFSGREGTFGLILAPTREIAQQIQATLEIFGTPRKIRSIVLIGGINMRIDALAINSYPQVIVATPGRLCDHLDRGHIWLDFIEMVVLDEADRMLDMGFSDQLARIMQEVPERRQTLLFSATIPPSVDKLSQRILHDPVRIAIGKPLSATHLVEQRMIWTREESKPRELQRILREEKGSIIVFTRSKEGATRVWRSLHSAGVYDATYIHSDRLQAHRESALAEFKAGKFRILIATDVAGRGIHIDDVAHVVNYDLPVEPENYVHRIGRTGRAGSTGRATTFVTTRDRGVLREIERLLGNRIPALNEEPTGEDYGSRSGGRQPRGGSSGHGHGGNKGGAPQSRAPRPSNPGGPEFRVTANAGGSSAAPAATGPSDSQDPKKRRRRRPRGNKPGNKPPQPAGAPQ